MSTLDNRAALVIGGSRGIGAATARALAAAGADVAITFARSPDRAEAVVKDIRATGRKALAIRADAAVAGENARAIATAVEALGGIDILFAAAGIFDTAPIAEIDGPRYDASFDIHVRSVHEAVQAAGPHLRPGGRIITVGSIFGDIAPFPGVALYTASKAAVAGFTRGWAREFAARDITANVIQPGPIDTEMNPSDATLNPMADTQRGFTALSRYGKAEDVAALAAFLASPAAGFITGQTINVDGGWTA